MSTIDIATQEYYEQVEQFQQRAARLGLGDAQSYYWYHTIDLGDGLVTPGMYDYRSTLAAFRFPETMCGMRVLDVGSATGFFAFEFEKRGGRVVSVELPSLEALDRFPGQTTEQVISKIGRMLESCRAEGSAPASSYSAADLYFTLLEGPFQFCRRRLNSNVARCYSTVYDLTAEKLGGAAFDLVFVGDVLVHTLYPLRVLAALVPLCQGTLVLSQMMPEQPAEAAMLYVGGENPAEDDLSWWLPNKPCMEQMLKKLGFRTVEEVGRNRGVLRPSGYPFDRTILHATK